MNKLMSPENWTLSHQSNEISTEMDCMGPPILLGSLPREVGSAGNCVFASIPLTNMASFCPTVSDTLDDPRVD